MKKNIIKKSLAWLKKIIQLLIIICLTLFIISCGLSKQNTNVNNDAPNKFYDSLEIQLLAGANKLHG